MQSIDALGDLDADEEIEIDEVPENDDDDMEERDARDKTAKNMAKSEVFGNVMGIGDLMMMDEEVVEEERRQIVVEEDEDEEDREEEQRTITRSSRTKDVHKPTDVGGGGGPATGPSPSASTSSASQKGARLAQYKASPRMNTSVAESIASVESAVSVSPDPANRGKVGVLFRRPVHLLAFLSSSL